MSKTKTYCEPTDNDVGTKINNDIINLIYQVLEYVRTERYESTDLYSLQQYIERKPQITLRRMGVYQLAERISADLIVASSEDNSLSQFLEVNPQFRKVFASIDRIESRLLDLLDR